MMQAVPYVLIVGAGPSGLTLAIQLHRFGIPFRIIDKKIKPVETSNALAVQTRTLEIWSDMELLDEALEKGHPVKGFNFYANGKKIFDLELSLLNSRYHFILGLSQHYTEALMIEYLQRIGIEIEMKMELIDIHFQNNLYSVVLKDQQGQIKNETFQYVIACDGSHSFIRNQLNIPFVGKDLTQHFVFADVEIESPLSDQQAHAFSSEKGVLFCVPYDRKYWRIIADVTRDPQLKHATTLTVSELADLVKARCPFKIKFCAPLWTSGFWIHERMIETFRHDNIFFVGDAAHIHSPVGGQGMNTGIQDAYNLAWKLSLTLQNKIKPNILETYHSERYPIAKNILKKTTAMTELMTLDSPFIRYLRDKLLGFLMSFKVIRKKLAEDLTESSIFYAKSILVMDYLDSKKGPKSGSRMLDVKVHHEAPVSYLSDCVRGIDFYLLIFTGHDASFDFQSLFEFVSQASYPNFKILFIQGMNNDLNVNGKVIEDKNFEIHKCYQVTEPTLYFIRPDKYIGFRGRVSHLEKFKEYLKNIFI